MLLKINGEPIPLKMSSSDATSVLGSASYNIDIQLEHGHLSSELRTSYN